MSLNRTQSPLFHKVEKLSFPDHKEIRLENGATLYSLRAGTQPVMRLDLIFDAGLTRQNAKGVSAFTASMMSEGTSQKSALVLAESLDYYGSYFQVKSNADDLMATLYCLEKHLKSCLPLFLEAVTDSIFPDKELDIQKKNSLQKLLVNEKKNSYLCRKGFYTFLLGENHPYAAFSEKTDIENINRELLLNHYKQSVLEGLKYVMISGNFQDETTSEVASTVGKIGFKPVPKTHKTLAAVGKTGKHFHEKTDSVQSAIRIGKLSINRQHGDFRKLQLLNLVFGGYFGSRLMKNIREEKGLTYGIYSVIEAYQNESVWYIESEMNAKNAKLGVSEIYQEMQKLRENEIPANELETARNYFLGSFLRSLDGPFSLADRLKIMIDFELGNNYYPTLVSELNAITSTQLTEIAGKYFTEENIVEMVVGKANA